MSVSDRLRADAGPIWEKIIEHPFVVELYRGDLPLYKFRFYILQDYNYLIAAMKNFGIIASRAPSVEALREIVEILDLEARSEFDGYTALLKELGYSLTDAAGIEPVEIGVSYSGFLLSTSSLGTYAESLAAVLPCFWSYAEIADRHREMLGGNANRLYREWGSAYLSDPYLRLVDKLKKLLDEAGEKAPYERLNEAFITASRYEYMFWDAVYQRREWPV
ncbi:MAG: thiaminase II [Candidatus Krumholzibacteria bacterium]|nr:thiaminase II [Candidatus Krumholzibacteria bacterium]